MYLRIGTIIAWSEFKRQNRDFNQTQFANKLIAVGDNKFLEFDPITKTIVRFFNPNKKIPVTIIEKTNDVFNQLIISKSVKDELIENMGYDWDWEKFKTLLNIRILNKV